MGTRRVGARTPEVSIRTSMIIKESIKRDVVNAGGDGRETRVIGVWLLEFGEVVKVVLRGGSARAMCHLGAVAYERRSLKTARARL